MGLLYSSFEILPNRFNSFFYVIACLRWSYYWDKHCGPGRHAVPAVRHLIIYYLQSSWGNNAQWPGGLQIIGLTTVSTLSFKSWRRDNAVLGFDSNEMRFSPSREEVLRGAFESKHMTSYDRYIRLWRSGTKTK